ncbi:hypothetical protein SAMN04488020_10768 [Palleronia marisminoris]|uniref:GTP-binding protein Era n=1 Tax=Palleronia marisminoris TaxID=315423 RepID=A0A1Y5T4C6_9RHOB|nr:DUF1491 family protein [Palleronia marisminoris]SFH13961.1 hypothetical protein SAMN04488020_10768 [Palleronia marisminoris]SLN53888.1 hypothetical protein PAM7066_02540 [Palleronia marisminoris]
MARLASGIWVSAYLMRLGQANIPAYVTARGDETAGAIFVKCATLDGQARVWSRAYDFEADARVWTEWSAGPESEVDAAIRSERGRDRDLWVIEVESREGRTLLDEEGLA